MKGRRLERARKSVAHPSRDQVESEFTAILGSLVARVAGAYAAILVDSEGETVDYAGQAVPFELRIAAAYWRLILREAHTQSMLRTSHWLVLRAERRSYVVHTLPEGYALVIVLAQAAGLMGWRRAVGICIRALSEEAGWSGVAVEEPTWFPIEVESDERGRPRCVRIAGRAQRVDVLGTLGSGGSGEVHREHGWGWRVRFDSGVEATVVREASGAWYADEPLSRAGGPLARGHRKKR
jgi:hypothetical protein